MPAWLTIVYIAFYVDSISKIPKKSTIPLFVFVYKYRVINLSISTAKLNKTHIVSVFDNFCVINFAIFRR